MCDCDNKTKSFAQFVFPHAQTGTEKHLGPAHNQQAHGGSGGSAGGDQLVPKMFNEAEERGQLMTQEGQSSKPKPGVTREQMEAFYKKRNAVQAARGFQYRDRKSAFDTVNGFFEGGVMGYKKIVAGLRLKLADGSEVDLKHKPAIDYFLMLIGKL